MYKSPEDFYLNRIGQNCVPRSPFIHDEVWTIEDFVSGHTDILNETCIFLFMEKNELTRGNS